jgi:hypothetical protein
MIALARARIRETSSVRMMAMTREAISSSVADLDAGSVPSMESDQRGGLDKMLPRLKR